MVKMISFQGAVCKVCSIQNIQVSAMYLVGACLAELLLCFPDNIVNMHQFCNTVGLEEKKKKEKKEVHIEYLCWSYFFLLKVLCVRICKN